MIVGFTTSRARKARLFEYHDTRSSPTEMAVSERINAYLVDGPNVLVQKRSTPLSPVLATATFGSMPRDGGGLVIDPDEYKTVIADPIAAKYVRPFKMGRELIHNTDRWCLWMPELDPADVQKSQVLRARLDTVRKSREKSRATSTRDYARQPHLFVQRAQPETAYVGVPAVVSERRLYYTVQRLEPDVIAGNKIYTVTDPDGLQFALLSSSMFVTWQGTVGGRMKSDLSFSSTIAWNNFPVPDLGDEARQRIIAAGRKILDARALHPQRSLADHYNPLTMDTALVKAHDELDREVDKAFSAPRRLRSEKQRLELLFRQYQLLTRDAA
ncbi:MAG: hypothetical protein L0H03_23850 [Rhodococcus sp. (in: high G+C Gram-positive bacteria)]|nr:hypothetical protein [Rhodococcus sp. (in: high G+C Gram-positive bacteria)]